MTDRFPPLSSLLAKHGAPGVAVAVVQEGALVETETCGLRSASAEWEVNSETVFEAASLSKPCFAFAALQLVDSGDLSLDEPLSSYLELAGSADPRMGAVTARHVLSHSSGLPNCLSEERPLRTWFPPGERFSYSGEGFTYLQKAREPCLHTRRRGCPRRSGLPRWRRGG